MKSQEVYASVQKTKLLVRIKSWCRFDRRYFSLIVTTEETTEWNSKDMVEKM